jgi:hypothetical protein
LTHTCQGACQARICGGIQLGAACARLFLPVGAPVMHPVLISISLLVCSNIFMTFAWYAHLKELNNKPWIIAALISWGIALFEYLLQVPANRIGYTALSVGQLKIIQEVITLSVFVPFSVMYLKEPLKLDYLWAGLCLLAAVYFMFRDKLA